MGRIYTATFNGETMATTGAPFDLIEIAAPADAAVLIHKILVGNENQETSDQLLLTLQRCTTGSGGTTVTPAPKNVGDAAFGGVVEQANSTIATGLTLLESFTFNVLSPMLYLPAPDDRWVLSPSGVVVLRMEDNPQNGFDLSCSVTFEVIGG